MNDPDTQGGLHDSQSGSGGLLSIGLNTDIVPNSDW